MDTGALPGSAIFDLSEPAPAVEHLSGHRTPIPFPPVVTDDRRLHDFMRGRRALRGLRLYKYYSCEKVRLEDVNRSYQMG